MSMNVKMRISLALALGAVAVFSPLLAVAAVSESELPATTGEPLEIPGKESGVLEGGEEKAVEVGKKLEVTGALELTYGLSRGDSGHVYGPVADKAEVGITYKPNDKFDLNTVLLYEDKKFSADEAKVTWHALPDDKLDITAGKQYVPFGTFESEMVSDPITKELGETRGNAVVQASNTTGKIHTAGYAFEGKSAQTGGTGKHKSAYGLSVGYETETASVGADYLSNLAESKFFGTGNDVTNTVPAVALHGSVKRGAVTLQGEHIAAMKSFQPDDLEGAVTVAAKPAVTHLEADVDLNNDRIVAVALNNSSNAEEIGLSKENMGVTYRQPLYKDLSGGIELMRAKGYDGVQDNIFTAQLSYEF